MTKITVDRALIEQAVELLDKGVCDFWSQYDDKAEGIIQELRAGLAEPAVEPVAWWVVNKTTDEKFATTRPDDWNNLNWLKYPLFTSPPPPAEPAPVPLLSDDEIHGIYDELARSQPYSGAVTRRNVARAIEQLVRRKAGL